METVTRDPNLPDITIAIDSTPYRMDLIYRTARTYAPPTQAEKNDYYKAYDPMIGLRIAATLSGFFILAVLYVVYKSKCKGRKWLRSSRASLTVTEFGAPQQAPGIATETDGSPRLSQWDSLLNSVPEEGRECDSSQVTPAANSLSSFAQPNSGARSHYYVDDSEMPAWKVYAKELFLYGGPGLWRSASLKGSDPVLLMQQNSFEGGINNSLRGGSLSGSVMGGLGYHHHRSASRKSSGAYSISNGSQTRLQVPGHPRVYRPSFSGGDLLFPSHASSEEGKTLASGVGSPGATGNSAGKKNLPARSVSFRESDLTNYDRCKRFARTRPGSLRTRADYFRWMHGSNNSNNNNNNNNNSGSSSVNGVSDATPGAGLVGHTPLALGSRRFSISTSKAPSRQASIHDHHRSTSRSNPSDIYATSVPPPSPKLRTVVVHRIAMSPSGVEAAGGGGRASKVMPGRSSSLVESTRAWRSNIFKMMRAESAAGGGSATGAGTGAPLSPRHKRKSPQIHRESFCAGGDGSETAPHVDAGVGNDSPADHFDICVIEATPAVSPCASIKTLDSDHFERSSATLAVVALTPSPSSAVRDRRKRLTRMKGQTIDHHDTASAFELLDLARADQAASSAKTLQVPVIDFGGPPVDPRCRSASLQNDLTSRGSVVSPWPSLPTQTNSDFQLKHFNRSTGALPNTQSVSTENAKSTAAAAAAAATATAAAATAGQRRRPSGQVQPIGLPVKCPTYN